MAKEMLGKKGFEIIEKMMDRANGKPTQVQDITQETKNKYEVQIENMNKELNEVKEMLKEILIQQQQ